MNTNNRDDDDNEQNININITPSDGDTYPLKQYHENLIKLVHLLEEDCIDETQLKDIIVNLKNKANQITWTCEHEEILKSLCERCRCYTYLHSRSVQYFSLLHVQFTMPMFIITLISSFCMFLSSQINTSYMGIIAGSINLLVATLQKIMEFIQPERFKIEHQSSSKAFEVLSENISVQLGLPADDRDPMPMYLTKTLNDFNIAWQSAPRIREDIIKKFSHKFKNINMCVPPEIGGPREVHVHTPIRNDSYPSDKQHNIVKEITNSLNNKLLADDNLLEDDNLLIETDI